MKLPKPHKPTGEQVRSFVLDVFFCVTGTLIYAAAVIYFVEPMQFVPGGLTTLGMILKYFLGGVLPFLGIGAYTFMLNVPLFLMALKKLGAEFTLKTAAVAGLMALSLDVVDALFTKLNWHYAGDEKLLAAIFGGLFCGIGLGLVFTRGVTTGGSDIVVRLLKLRFPHLSLGRLVLITDATVLLLAGIVYRSMETVLFSMIVVFLDSMGIDYVLKGRSDSKMLLIVTDNHDAVRADIIRELDRGVTLLEAEGGFTGTPKRVLMSVVRAPEVIKVRRIVARYDERPFIIITDSEEVLGEGFKSHQDTM
ncbi:MAG: YitT family protein [Clostridia bacterium]|nr:YitT family protein [Clostridia bacterium]MBR5410368.1 YitT family protein [Clostridia bacterium]